jgi:hypothetical protein
MRRLAIIVSIGVAVVFGAPSFDSIAHAQESGKRVAGKGARKPVAKRAKKAKRANARDKDRNAPVRAASRDKSSEAPPAPEPTAADADPHAAHAPSADAAALASDADERVRKEGSEEIKTVEFGGLDIEGQLKTPQMLYFLNRLRAEFSRPELPHRSFIPELQRGTEENGF